MSFEEYLRAAVLEPLGMSATELRGSPAHAMWSTLRDLTAFVAELIAPTLITRRDAADCATTPAFPDLAGIVPGLGRYDPCPWGLGFEIRGRQVAALDGNTQFTGDVWSLRWGRYLSVGGFGGPQGDGAVGCVALTDRPFDEWSAEALVRWPAFSDRESIAEAASAA